jgi:hypothetical protein
VADTGPIDIYRIYHGRVMVTGKGMPILRARGDRARLLTYCERFTAARRSIN